MKSLIYRMRDSWGPAYTSLHHPSTTERRRIQTIWMGPLANTFMQCSAEERFEQIKYINKNKRCNTPGVRGWWIEISRCNASAVRITKLWAQWGIMQVQTWVGLKVCTHIVQSKNSQGGCERSISTETGFIFWSMRMTHCGSPSGYMEIIQEGVHALWTRLTKPIQTCTHTHTWNGSVWDCKCVRKCVWKWGKKHLLSDRPQQQRNGCVGLWSITDVWQAYELWHSYTATSTRSSLLCLSSHLFRRWA